MVYKAVNKLGREREKEERGRKRGRKSGGERGTVQKATVLWANPP